MMSQNPQKCPYCGETDPNKLTVSLTPDDRLRVDCKTCLTFGPQHGQDETETKPAPASRKHKKRHVQKIICPECQAAILRRANMGGGRTAPEERLYHCPECGEVFTGEMLIQEWKANQRPNIGIVP